MVIKGDYRAVVRAQAKMLKILPITVIRSIIHTLRLNLKVFITYEINPMNKLQVVVVSLIETLKTS